MTSKTARTQSHSQQQQQPNNNNNNQPRQSKSPAAGNFIKSPLVQSHPKPTAAAMDNKTINNIVEQQTNLSGNLKPSGSFDQMIDEKFNELARKILGELRENSIDFFNTLDQIISQPASRRPLANKQQLKKPNNQNNTKRSFTTTNDLSQQDNGGPKSLPTEASMRVVHHHQAAPAAKIKEQIWRLESMMAAGSQGQPPVQQPIRKSATTANCDSSSLRRQLSATNRKQSEVLEDAASKQQRLIELYKRRIQYRPPVSDDDSEEDDDDDDDDEDSRNLFDDSTDDADFGVGQEDMDIEQYFSKGRKISSSSERASQLAKSGRSLTAGSRRAQMRSKPEATSRDNFKSSSPKQRTSQQTITTSRTLNPVARSNTIGLADHTHNQNLNQQRPGASAGSQLLSGMSQLYKPHMNYSTSVLGSHRLSDDDEIIIIPTQSPSLLSISSSADGQQENNNNNNQSTTNGLDPDQIERFSISRTKNFWEKLSKAGPKRSSSSAGSHSAALAANSTGSNSKSAAISEGGHQHQEANISGNSPNQNGGLPGNKLIGVRMNGHSPTSNFGLQENVAANATGSRPKFNYDDGGVELHYRQAGRRLPASAQNAPISHVQQHQKLQQLRDDDDMSRQNRFRQTR